ncbi:MAG: hypothetical protein ABIN83_00370, partial [Sphingomicrobium sp.]
PRIIFGSAYADMRIVPFMLAVALLAIRFSGETDLKMARTLAGLGLAFYLLRLVATTASLAMAGADQKAQLMALDHVPPGARVLSLVGEDCGSMWQLPRNTHLGALAIVRRSAFSNDQWPTEGANLLTVNYRRAGRFMFDPSQIVRSSRCAGGDIWSVDRTLRAIPSGAFDYLWTVNMPPHDPALMPPGTKIWVGPKSALYRLN